MKKALVLLMVVTLVVAFTAATASAGGKGRSVSFSHVKTIGNGALSGNGDGNVVGLGGKSNTINNVGSGNGDGSGNGNVGIGNGNGNGDNDGTHNTIK